MREATSRSGWTGSAGSAGALVLGSALAAAGAAGCFGDTSTGSSSAGGYGYAPIYDDAGSASPGASSGQSGQPLLAVVDTGQTLSAPAGQGVGVFIEYQTGGHWNLSWTCDTELTGRNCPFGIAVALTSPGTGVAAANGATPGTIVNVTDSVVSADGSVTTPSPSEISASSTTGNALDAIGFDTYPGATITLTVTLSGAENGSFLFFVQDGKVNGGYKGAISDPLMLVPSAA